MGGTGPPWGAGWGRNTRRMVPSASRWLRARLAAGPVPVRTLRGEAAAQGFSLGSFERARVHVGVVSRRVGHHWEWSLS